VSFFVQLSSFEINLQGMRWLKRIFLYGSFFVFIFFIGSNIWVVFSTSNAVYSQSENLPDYPVALVLGTSNKTTAGTPNQFFERRMDTAAALFKVGKIQHFIVSGDNRTKFYNEPFEMQKALNSRGVPSSAITLDYAGLRTLDSVVRCKEVFGQDKIIIITQPFHSYRALFICKFYGIEAAAMGASDPGLDISFKVKLREYFARSKAVLDLYLFGTEPRHLGPKEPINLNS
jgi:SanA protein